MNETVAVIALGSNLPSQLGTPMQTLRRAMDRLQALSTAEVKFSSPYRNAAVGCEPGAPDFVNAVALLSPPPRLSALGLLRELQQIEADFGRRREGGRGASRPLDLDLICLGDLQMDTPELVLPHPRAGVRAFVLAPLAELLPDLVLPGEPVSVRELLADLSAAAGELRPLSWEES